ARFTGPGRVAGKTGTTDDYGDAWFVGYTPKLTAAVWMGWADGSSRKMNDVRGLKINGGSLPATIWRRFMEQATRDTDAGTFPDVSAFPGRAVVGVRAILPSTTTSSTPTTSTSVPGQPATTVPSTPSTPSTTAPTTPTTTRPSTSTTEVTAPVTTTTKVAPAGQRGPPGGLAP
ncbi:MAG: penicillin-binding protein, partial [Acidimicrobiaceae bacterium]|nr:penicillin-binding protein [Acidimicrobiaceae bacterium]